MKTAQIIRRIVPGEWGGTETAVTENALALRDCAVESEIFATKALCPVAWSSYRTLSIRRFGYFYPYFPMTAERRAALDRKGGDPVSFPLFHALMRGNYDLLHVHNLGRLARMTGMVARQKHIPWVISLHGGCLDVPREEMEELTRPLEGLIPYGGVLERALGLRYDPLTRADGIICVGENEKRLLEASYPDKRVLFLPNGVDMKNFARPVEPVWRKKLNLEDGTRLILTVSRIDYQKNQKLLVPFAEELARRGTAAHFLLIGPVSARWYAADLQKLIDERGLTSMFTIVPGLDPGDDALLAAYQEADCFVLPSRHEPFGIVALEAWSANVPLLAANVGGLARLVRDGETGMLFESNSPESLLAAYDRLWPVAERLRRNAHREVEAHYTWTRSAEKLSAFYREIVESRGAGRAKE
ncbi:MAG: glycosyltransferase family 4 protein [Victivallaceae bacterium]|nr:glycosyltransferase family 4 protein [Victivallaceae bacterium]